LSSMRRDRLRKARCSPFDRLRANGKDIESLKSFPFMLSSSKHERYFSITDLTLHAHL